MPLPLYRLDERFPSANDQDLRSPNAGLWFEKFYRDYQNDFSATTTEKSMLEDISKPKFINKDQITKTSARMTNLIIALKGETKVYKTQGAFVTGMGQNHPLENGFSWHPTLSAPYIAGSAVKGLLRHWMRFYRKEAYELIAEKWFGNEPAAASNQSAGSLVFFDALPATKDIKVGADIMTPHFGDWYAKGRAGNAKDAPHDRHEPKPLKFLAVKEASFLFAIAPRNPQDSDLQAHAKLAMQELGFALEHLGAGAKTATGFGRMIEDTQAQQVINQAKEQANTSQLSSQAKSLTAKFIAEGGQPNAASGNEIFAFLTQTDFAKLTSDEILDVRTLIQTYKASNKKKDDFNKLKKKFNELHPN
jgi:CRISPR-associated protein Cmr6